jgi:predicted dehydrogenase
MLINMKKSKKNNPSSRRDFLKNTSLAAAGFFIVPRHVLGRGYVAPSDKLNIAGIGAGGKGTSDLAEFAKSPKVNIVALVDVDDRQAVTSRKNFPNAKYYRDFREMLDKEKNNIDACSVSTPDNTHAVAALSAMQLGKHVYVQKPLTHDIFEARTLTEAAKRYKVVTQMGNQGSADKKLRRAVELVWGGVIAGDFGADWQACQPRGIG